jgi:hypothetical protein
MLLTVGLGFAQSSSTNMQVTVQVIARAIVTVDSQPATVDITETDIARGYVDVEAPLQWRGRTNSRNGYLLQVTKSSESFSAVDLAFAGTAMHIAEESWVQRPYVAGGEVLTVRARLVLNGSTQPGRHALPISVSATPL